MSKKAILNTTSRKKRNGMLSWSNSNSAALIRPVGVGGAYVNNAGYFGVWCPTAMTLDAASTIANQPSRTASTCYMRGLSEHIRIQTSSGTPWFHRRICFLTRGSTPFHSTNSADTPTAVWSPSLDTSNGVERVWFNELLNNMNNTIAAQQGVLFKGVIGKDWNDLITAPVDTARVTVKYDKTWTMQSGNEEGLVRERKLWHGMNKNLVFDDDENGDVEGGNYFSVDAKPGMGDYFVVDIIQPGINGTAEDYFTILANSTLYWHEK